MKKLLILSLLCLGSAYAPPGQPIYSQVKKPIAPLLPPKNPVPLRPSSSPIYAELNVKAATKPAPVLVPVKPVSESNYATIDFAKTQPKPPVFNRSIKPSTSSVVIDQSNNKIATLPTVDRLNKPTTPTPQPSKVSVQNEPIHQSLADMGIAKNAPLVRAGAIRYRLPVQKSYVPTPADSIGF